MSCLAAFNSVAYSEEKFVPLAKVREQMSCPDYGPSMNEIIHPTFQDVIKDFECLLVTRLKDDAKDELLLYSSLCINGHLIAEKGKPYFVNEFKQLRELSKLLLNYDSYGDEYWTTCNADVAFEFISHKGRVVLLYDSKLKMGYFANVVFKLDDPTRGMHVTFDKPVNKILLKLLDDVKEPNNKDKNVKVREP